MLTLSSCLFPFVMGIVFLFIKGESRKRHILYFATAILTDLLVILAMRAGGEVVLTRFSENLSLRFAVDGLGKFFLSAVMILYTASIVYSFEYMKMEEEEERFFGFCFISFGALIAVCFAGNLITLYLFFEFLTLTTVPLVLHERTKAAVSAGLKYLFYSIGGALIGLFAIFFVYYYAGSSADFVMGGFLDPAKTAGHMTVIYAAAMAGIFGFGTKAGLYPMHGWLPTAHPIAPAPASALLSGIVAKAGVVAIIRLVYYSIGADVLKGTWVQKVWMCAAMLTIFMGSMMAFREKVLKKRLAYSTISQISYILLGLSFLSKEGLAGGLLHVMSHMASKGCLFLAAGVFIYKLGKRNVADLRGIGKIMPVTLCCFTAVSLSLIGIPPMGGFLSKWVIAEAAISSGISGFRVAAPIVLLISALLTGGYLLPVVVDGFFPGHEHGENNVKADSENQDPSCLMTVPMICLALVALIMGIAGRNIVGYLGF